MMSSYRINPLLALMLLAACFSTALAAQYTPPTYTSPGATGDYCANIQINTSPAFNSGTISDSATDYNYHTGVSATFEAGISYTMTVLNNPAWDGGIAAWLDLNGDGDYADANEYLGATAVLTLSQSGTINFTIPIGAAAQSSTRFRVIQVYSSIPNDPIGSYGFGQCEEYDAVINNNAGDPEIQVFGTGSNPANSGATFNIGPFLTGAPTNYTFTVSNLGATNPLNVTGIAAAASGVGNVSVTASPTLVPASPINAGASATFDVAVTPTADGPFEFTITINNNDADEGTYTIVVQGSGFTPAALPYTEDFEGASPLANWAISGQAGAWHVTTNYPAGGAACLGYCTGETQPSATADGNYDFGGVTNSGTARSPQISIPAGASVTLSFDHYQDTETGVFDQLTVGISLNGTTFATTLLGPSGYNNGYTTRTFDISAYAGQVVYVLFFFDTIDNFANSTTGIRIDNLQVIEAPEMDVLRGATPVSDGGTDSGVDILTAGTNLTYTIENNGGSDLNLTGTPLVSVTAGTNVTSVNVTTSPSTPVAGAGSTQFIINVVPTAAGAYDFTVSIDNDDPDENPYDFTVSGNAVSNIPPAVTVGAGNWVDAGGGLFTLTLNPGATINDTLNVDDATPDNMTVDVVTAAALTGITGQPADITTPTAGTINLTWTGTADGSNAPGNYDWTIDISDGTSTTSITARIIIVDVAPQHTAATGISGDGSAGTPYLATYAQNDPASLSVNLANVSDANTGQTLNLTNVLRTGGTAAGGSGFTYSLVGGVLSVAPSATLDANDVGTNIYTMDVDDGTNTVTINVTITVLGNSGAITITNTSPLAAGTVGSVYATVTLTATGGTGPYTYSVLSGALPAGLSLSPAGDITGTPTTAGTANFTVRAVDSLNDSGTKAFSLTVNAPASGSGGGGGGGGGGCAANDAGGSAWLALLGLLGLVALAIRTRKA